MWKFTWRGKMKPAKCPKCDNKIFIIKGKEVKMIKAYFVCKDCGKILHNLPDGMKIKIIKYRK